MGILDRYLAREILVPFATATLFLSELLLATQLLAEAQVLFGSGASLVDVVALAAGLTPHLLGAILPIAFLLGTVIGLGRLAEDREVLGVAAAGVPPWRLFVAPVALAAAVGLFALWLARSVEPPASALVRERAARILTRKLSHDVRPGVFYDQLPGYVLYVERSHHGRWSNVFIDDLSRPTAPVLVLAARGRLDPAGDGGALRLVLEHGELHGAPSPDAYASATFERAEEVISLPGTLDRSGLARNARGASFADAPARAREERGRGDVAAARHTEAWYHRRIAEAFAVLPFALVAVPLGASRRLRRGGALAGTVLAVVLHYLLLRTGETLAQDGVLPAWLALALPAAVLSGIGLALAALHARGALESGR